MGEIVQGQMKGKVGRDEPQRPVRSYKGIGYSLKGGGKKVRSSIRISVLFIFLRTQCQCGLHTHGESVLRCSAGL